MIEPVQIPEGKIEALHAAYCEAAGTRFAVSLTFDRRCDWRRWFDRGAKCDPKGWDVPQLLAVISHLKRQVRAGKGVRESLQFSRLIGCQGRDGASVLNRFEERLLLAREGHSREHGRRGRITAPTEVQSSDGTRRLLAPEEMTPPENIHQIGSLLEHVQTALGKQTASP